MGSYIDNYKNKGEIPPEKLNGALIIISAENAGLFNRGSTKIEETTGNYGKDIAIDAANGVNRTIFLLSDKISEEKTDLIRACGSDIAVLPPSDLPDSYQDEVVRIEMDTPDAVPGMMVC